MIGADLALGHLDAGLVLGGEMRIERGPAEVALEVAADRAALGLRDVVNENVAGGPATLSACKRAWTRRATSRRTAIGEAASNPGH